MKRKFFATTMALLLSVTMLAGCGDSDIDDRSASKDRKQQTAKNDYKEKDDNGSTPVITGQQVDTDEYDEYDENGENNDHDSYDNRGGYDDHDRYDDRDYYNDHDDYDNYNNEGIKNPNPQVVDNSAKANYLYDIKIIAEMAAEMENIDDSGDPDEMMDLFRNIVGELNVKTPEGKAIKDDIQSMVKILEIVLNDPNDMEKVMQAYTELLNLIDKMESDMENLVEAAENAGIDESDLAELDMILY